jgi:hypothetical protein
MEHDHTYTEDDAYAIAEALVQAGSHLHSDGPGWKTCCPCCDHQTLSVAAADGNLMVTCHRGCDRMEILRALREAGLFEFKQSAASEIAARVWAAAQRKPWFDMKENSKRDILRAFCYRSEKCGKVEFHFSSLDIALEAHCSPLTALKRTPELEQEGWLIKVTPAHGPMPACQVETCYSG